VTVVPCRVEPDGRDGGHTTEGQPGAHPQRSGGLLIDVGINEPSLAVCRRSRVA